MAQTAVEWFMDKIAEKEPNGLYVIITFEDVQNVFEQAKAMEKNQILNTWYACKLSIIDRDGMSIEDYYNKTYNK